MRYFIQKSFQNELILRKEFLYEVLALWTIPHEYNCDFIVLNSIPLDYLDVCFILGHNYTVKNFINQNNIYEKHIVAITCDGSANFGDLKLKDQILYLPHQESNNLAPLLKGKLYGFNFDLTESEILLYNTPKSLPLAKKLELCFSKY